MTSKKRLDAFLAITPDVDYGDFKPEGEVKEGKPYFEFKKASLSFGGENYALKDIDLVLRQGESVGITAGTGS